MICLGGVKVKRNNRTKFENALFGQLIYIFTSKFKKFKEIQRKFPAPRFQACMKFLISPLVSLNGANS